MKIAPIMEKQNALKIHHKYFSLWAVGGKKQNKKKITLTSYTQETRNNGPRVFVFVDLELQSSDRCGRGKKKQHKG